MITNVLKAFIIIILNSRLNVLMKPQKYKSLSTILKSIYSILVIINDKRIAVFYVMTYVFVLTFFM
jgi:hypothetical protein